jgi:hypothetical protein
MSSIVQGQLKLIYKNKEIRHGCQTNPTITKQSNCRVDYADMPLFNKSALSRVLGHITSSHHLLFL